MEEQRERNLGPREPLYPAVTDHAFEADASMANPFGVECGYPDPGTGEPCGRTPVEHARGWG